MATKKPAKKKVSKKTSAKSPNLFSKYWQNYRTIIILAGLVLSFIAYWVVAQELPKRAEKRDLIQKHQELEEISDQIISIYPTNDLRKERSCDYTSTKFEKGTLSCNVYVDLNYQGKTIEEANTIKNKLTNKFGLVLKPSSFLESHTNNFEFLDNGELVNSFNSKLKSSLEGCTLGYVYGINETLEISLSCYVSPAKAEHFSLKE